MIRLGIAGACGKMGQRIGALAAADHEFSIAGALEWDKSTWLGMEYGKLLGMDKIKTKVEADAKTVLGKIDVLIDFAVGNDVLTHVALAREKKVKMVIGTTGIKDAGMAEIHAAAKEIPIVMDSNMSLGINTILEKLGQIADALGPAYDIDIIETHHRMKKDWPSGTGLNIAKVLEERIGRGIRKDGQPRSGQEIVLHSLRGGDVVGDHTVVFAGPGERVEVTHRASSRDVFAYGALRAAKFVMQMKPGKLYKMLDVMGVNHHGN